jgi:hypothetical protein
VTPKQIAEFGLPPNLEAKESSSRYKRFVEKQGKHVYELEALTPKQLQDALQKSIDTVIDTEAFNRELDAEKEDAYRLQAIRNAAIDSLKSLKFDEL